MNEAIKFMLSKYECETTNDFENALHEIFQSIALLGLWRAKFFEHAAFYGGTALRIVYGLDRFSEDLDFSLLEAKAGLDLAKYNSAVVRELSAFGFDVSVEQKQKVKSSQIQSAFLKANTREQLIQIELPNALVGSLPRDKIIKIKMEVDIDPPVAAETEAKMLIQPIPFSVLTYDLPSLFAGKIHAVLCRSWKAAVKGRDYYDLVWYLSRGVQPNLDHLKARLVQSGHMKGNAEFSIEVLKKMLAYRFSEVSFDSAKKDVRRFIKDTTVIDSWSCDYFTGLSNLTLK